MEHECCICLEGLIAKDEFNKRFEVAAMNGCGHLFHEDCLLATFSKLKGEELSRFPVQLRAFSTTLYKDHPKCPKCRAIPTACKSSKCMAEYGYYGAAAYYCFPATRIFIEDYGGDLFKPATDAEDIVFIEIQLPDGTTKKLDYARAARNLGLDLEAVAEAVRESVEAMPNVNGMIGLDINAVGNRSYRLGKKSKAEITAVKTKVEKVMKTMKEKQANEIIKTCIQGLEEASLQLHDILNQAEECEILRAQLEAAEQVKLDFADQRVHDAEMGYEAAIANMERDRQALDRRILDRKAAHEKTKADLRERDKQIKELKASGKKNKGLVGSLEKEKFKSANEMQNVRTKLSKAESTVANQKSKLVELKEKLKVAEQRAKDLEKAKLQPKVTPERRPKDIIDLSSSAPSTPSRKRVKIDHHSSPRSTTETDLSDPPQSPQSSSAARQSRKVVPLSSQESADFSKIILRSSRQAEKIQRDSSLKDDAIEKLLGWMSSSQASSTITRDDTPPRETRAGAKKRKADAEQ